MTENENGRSLTADILSMLQADFGSRQDVTGWTRGDFLHAASTTRGALVSSVLFAPTFVEIEGLIFLEDLGPTADDQQARDGLAKNIRAARDKSGNDLALLLGGYNWVEVPYLFADREGSDEENGLLARSIADAWRIRLRGLYPDRKFEVRVISPHETGSTVGVGFREL